MDRYRYYRSILSVMLATDSIDPSVKHFSFLTDSIDHRFEKKFIFSNHRIKIFFSSKDHRSNRCFLQLIDYRYRSNRCFFHHRCPTMVRNQFGLENTLCTHPACWGQHSLSFMTSVPLAVRTGPVPAGWLFST